MLVGNFDRHLDNIAWRDPGGAEVNLAFDLAGIITPDSSKKKRSLLYWASVGSGAPAT